MKEHIQAYEVGHLAYKNNQYTQSQEHFKNLLDNLKTDTEEKTLLSGFAHAMYGLSSYHSWKAKRTTNKGVPDVELAQEYLQISKNLQAASRLFYGFGAEMLAGFVLPFCGTILAEQYPSAGLRTLYDGLYRLENGGAPLKALAVKEALPVVSKRLLTYLECVYHQHYEHAPDSLAKMEVLYTWGECLILEGKVDEALPLVTKVYEYYKEATRQYDNPKYSPPLIAAAEKKMTGVEWTFAHATQDEKLAEECVNSVNIYGEWLPWFPGGYTKFPDAPKCTLDLREFPPLPFMSELHIPFSTEKEASAYWKAGVEILGRYNSQIPEDLVARARLFLEESVEIYTENEDFKNASQATVCLVEALIRQNREKVDLNPHVNFALKYLDSTEDQAMLDYLRAMVVPNSFCSN